MSDFIPNSFQTPNTYVDEFMHLLTAEEYKVLSYASRRIFGFQKRADRISLSQFAEGKEYDGDGARDYGTGLNKTTIRKALDGLIRFGLIEQIAENDPLKNEGARYRPQLDSSKVDHGGLRARRAVARVKAAARTETARRQVKRLETELFSDGSKQWKKTQRKKLRYRRAFYYRTLCTRDGEFCQCCGRTDNLVIDHVIPIARGGRTEIENLQLLCDPCNGRKLARIVEPKLIWIPEHTH